MGSFNGWDRATRPLVYRAAEIIAWTSLAFAFLLGTWGG